MALEMNTDKVICPTCGAGYSKRKGFFPVSYGELYKGLGISRIADRVLTKYIVSISHNVRTQKWRSDRHAVN